MLTMNGLMEKYPDYYISRNKANKYYDIIHVPSKTMVLGVNLSKLVYVEEWIQRHMEGDRSYWEAIDVAELRDEIEKFEAHDKALALQSGVEYKGSWWADAIKHTYKPLLEVN